MKIHSKLMPLPDLIDLLNNLYDISKPGSPTLIRVEGHIIGDRKIIKLSSSTEVKENSNESSN